jgi:hypothetical protein
LGKVANLGKIKLICEKEVDENIKEGENVRGHRKSG